MSIEKDCGELKKMFENISEAPIAPAKPETKPETKPDEKPKEKPRSPIAPKPGVSPKPKANRDVELFLRKRGMEEGKVSTGLKKWRRRQGKGKIMKPKTFKDIEKKAKEAGADDPEKVAGAAYWKTAKAKYKEAKK